MADTEFRQREDGPTLTRVTSRHSVTDAQVHLVRQISSADHRAVVVTRRADGSPHCALVHAGVLDSPFDGEPVIAFVSWPRTAKLTHLRYTPSATLVFRDGWRWVAVEGTAELVGPRARDGALSADAYNDIVRRILVASGRGAEIADVEPLIEARKLTGVLVHMDHIYSGF
jgi:hypothetical protein